MTKSYVTIRLALLMRELARVWIVLLLPLAKWWQTP